jgi:hypothetical protein
MNRTRPNNTRYIFLQKRRPPLKANAADLSGLSYSDFLPKNRLISFSPISTVSEQWIMLLIVLTA